MSHPSSHSSLQLTSSKRTVRCWSSFRSGPLCSLTWWRRQEEEGKMMEGWSSAPPPPEPLLPPPAGTCSELTLLMLLRLSLSSTPPLLKVIKLFFCFFCDAKTSKVQLKHSVLPVSTVDRLTELLLNSHKSTVTNGNQEFSSESAVEN